MLMLLVLLHATSCSVDILYTSRGHEALRRFRQYGSSNIYGIKCRLSRQDIAPFPLIHKVGTNTNLRRPKTTATSSTVIIVQRNSSGEAEDVDNADKLDVTAKSSRENIVSSKFIPIPRVEAATHVSSPSRRIRLTKQLNEIRKVKRIGGGYPYGPKNSTVVEFSHPLSYEKSSLGSDGKILFKTPRNANQSSAADRDDIWAIRHFSIPTSLYNASLSCRYCIAYWKIQKRFKPPNIYAFCCK